MNLVTSLSENPIFHPCRIASELDYSLSAAQNLASLEDSPRRSAASIRVLVAINRRKHRHTAKCSQCLINEALESAVRSKPAGTLFAQRATAARKAVAHA